MEINIQNIEFDETCVEDFREFLKWYKKKFNRPYKHISIPDNQKIINVRPGIIYTNALYDGGRKYWAIRINKEGKITAQEFFAFPNENICGPLRYTFKHYAHTIIPGVYE